MSPFIIILLLIIFGLIALFIWNGFNFRSLKKLASADNKQLNDPKYWELKYKFEFIIAIVGIITAVAGLLGYNSLKSIEDSVKQDFNSKVDSIKNELELTYKEVDQKLKHAHDSVRQLSGSVKLFQSSIHQNSKELNILNSQQNQLQKLGVKSQRDLRNVSDQIDTINKNNKVRKEFYLVSNFPIKLIKNSFDPVTIKFSELKTSNGDRLPVFHRPPIVISGFNKSTRFDIYSVSENDFKVMVMADGMEINDGYYKTTFYASFIIYEDK